MFRASDSAFLLLTKLHRTAPLGKGFSLRTAPHQSCRETDSGVRTPGLGTRDSFTDPEQLFDAMVEGLSAAQLRFRSLNISSEKPLFEEKIILIEIPGREAAFGRGVSLGFALLANKSWDAAPVTVSLCGRCYGPFLLSQQSGDLFPEQQQNVQG